MTVMTLSASQKLVCTIANQFNCPPGLREARSMRLGELQQCQVRPFDCLQLVCHSGARLMHIINTLSSLTCVNVVAEVNDLLVEALNHKSNSANVKHKAKLLFDCKLLWFIREDYSYAYQSNAH